MFICPSCKSDLEQQLDGDIVRYFCAQCKVYYNSVNDLPIFIRDKDVVEYIISNRPKLPKKQKLLLYSNLFSLSLNIKSDKNFQTFFSAIPQNKKSYVLNVGCGNQKTHLDKFVKNKNIKIINSDINPSADVDVFCDAHYLPFENGFFDGVIITAVIEHLIRPEEAIREIYRVLKPKGIVYSEVPFLQQVHEGAYDFSRYTLNGHYRLFEYFAKIDSGLIAGPATSLSWSIQYFFLSFFKSKTIQFLIKILTRILFFWIKYFDLILIKKHNAVDSASCTYFIGRKVIDKISDNTIIKGYDEFQRADN